MGWRDLFWKSKSTDETKKKLVSQRKVAADYKRSTVDFLGLYSLDKLPPFTLFTADLMLRDPQVMFGLMVRNGGLLQSEVEITGENQQEVEFVKRQWERIWNNYASHLLRAKRWGCVPFEVTFRQEAGEFGGWIGVDELHDFHPRDARVLTRDGDVCGFRLMRLQKTGQAFLESPSALWVTYQAETGNPYGKSLNYNAYGPWWEKWMDRGGKQVLRLRMIKDAYSGDVFKGPNILVEMPDGSQKPLFDMFRAAVEDRLSGSPLFIPDEYDSEGNSLVEYIPPSDNGKPEGILEWNERLDWDIWKGQGVFREVFEAAESGSGYSGRSIPMVTFLSTLAEEFREVLHCVDRDVLRPLTHINMGHKPTYEIKPKSLIETFTDDMAGTNMGGGAMGGTQGRVPGQQQQPPQPQPGQASSQPSNVDVSQFRLQGKSAQFAEDDDNPWKPYTGPRGGNGWKHSELGFIRYQEDRPGSDEVGNVGSEIQMPKKKQPPRTDTGNNSDDDLVAVEQGQYGEIQDRLEKFAKSKGMTLDELAKRTNFSDARQMVVASQVAKDKGYDTLTDASKALGVKVGSGLASALGVRKTRFVGDDFDTYIVESDTGKKSVDSVDPDKLKEAMENARKILELMNPGESKSGQFAEDDPFSPESSNDRHDRTIQDAQDALSRLTDWTRSKADDLLKKNDLVSWSLLPPLEELIKVHARYANSLLYESLIAAGIVGMATVVSHLRKSKDAPDVGEVGEPSDDSTEKSRTSTLEPEPPTPRPADAFTPTPNTPLPPPPNVSPPISPPLPPPADSDGLSPDPEPPSVRFPELDSAVNELRRADLFTSEDYLEVAREAQEGAFAITGDLEENTLNEMRLILSRNLQEGADAEAFVNEVDELIVNRGGLSETHLHQVFRTNMQAKISDSMERTLNKPLIVDFFQYRAYFATTDERTRKNHLALERMGLNGTNLYNKDDPVWHEFRSPWDFNCRCSWAPVSVRDAAAKGVTEAKEWWDRAVEMAAKEGGKAAMYLHLTAPESFQFVPHPPFNAPEAFQRDTGDSDTGNQGASE